jgi:poly(3-hydroxyalkanoate) synthetase
MILRGRKEVSLIIITEWGFLDQLFTTRNYYWPIFVENRMKKFSGGLKVAQFAWAADSTRMSAETITWYIPNSPSTNQSPVKRTPFDLKFIILSINYYLHVR